MLRITCLLAVFAAALPVAAATKWDKKVEKAAEAVRAASARAPGVALDTRIKAAELLRPTHPQLAWEFATPAAEELKAASDGGSLTQRLTAVLLAINPAEGERIARTLPQQSIVYSALVSYWTRKQDPVRAAEVLREAWQKGFYLSSAGSVLSALREKRPEDAAALFLQMLDQLQPEKATRESVMALLPAARSMADKDPAATKAAFIKLLDVVSSEKFDAEGALVMNAIYKFGDKSVKTTGARDSFLLGIGIYLHALDSELYARNEKLFEKWRDDIAKLKPGEERKAATAMYVFMPRGTPAGGSATGAVSPQPAKPAPPSKPAPFEEAYAKAISAQQDAPRAFALMVLLRRNDLTQSQQLQTTRELLRVVPKLPLPGRFELADGAFRAAFDLDLKPLLKPAAQTLVAAIADLDRCTEPSCESMRRSGRLATSYDQLAAAVRRSKLRIEDPAVAARVSLIDLRDVLEENYDFKIAGIHGGDYALKAQKGRVVMLNFWATW